MKNCGEKKIICALIFVFLGGFEFEADIDNLQIRCLAEGNPPPNVFWRKAGGESILR